MTSDDGTARSLNAVLDDLAAALGIPPAAFFVGPDDGKRVAESVELLRLWTVLDHTEQRQEILDHLRRMTGAAPQG